MDHLNQTLFLLINAGPQPDAAVVSIAKVLANALIWIVPVGLVVGWLRGSLSARQRLITATVAVGIGLALNQAIGLAWYHPRPFAMGLGRTLIAHAADSSFPSDHATVIWAVAFALIVHPRMRVAGAALALIGALVAWARIYTGVHCPLDMVGAATVAMGSVWLALLLETPWIARMMPGLIALHKTLFAPLIRRAWVRE